MRLSSLLNLGLIAVGAAAAIPTLLRRREWEQSNQRTGIVLDYDDALSVCTRAAMPLGEFLQAARRHGATHLALPELTLNRLMREGRVVTTVPAGPISSPPPIGAWIYLASPEPPLIQHLVREFSARLPSSHAHLLSTPLSSISNLQSPLSNLQPPQVPAAHLPCTLALAGDLPSLGEIGLGFETEVTAQALLAGLELVPRPVAYAWPEDRLIERTMIQVAGLGAAARIVAFDGDIILGHEMHLDTTVRCLENLRLTFAYFSETRHQKGDWFIAKRLAPKGQVILAHFFTPAALAPEDYHSAAHHWGMLAHMRGIRLCYINVFRRIHAADPLECLKYLEHVRKNLDAFDGKTTPAILPAPDRQALALTGLASAGAVSLAATRTFGLPEPSALALTAAAAAGAASLPYLDHPRGELEQAYPPSYAPKLLALAGAAAAPLAADDSFTGAFVHAGVASALAALTTGQDYQLHIEEYRSLNADLFLPLAGVLFRELAGSPSLGSDLQSPHGASSLPSPALPLSLTALALIWYVANKLNLDLLGALDKDLPAGHTHHLSAAQRFMGDALIALGPRPARKWAGLGLAAVTAAHAVRRRGDPDRGARTDRPYEVLAAALLGAIGNAVMLAAFRTPERPLAETVPTVGRSWAWGAALSLLLWSWKKQTGPGS